MTSEEWKKVEERLKSLHDIVKLKCDEYEVSLALGRVSQFKNEILVYIGGVFKGAWLSIECEERRRFLREVSKSTYSRKQKEHFKKLSKKTQKEIGIDINRTYSYYMPTWTSFNALKRHLIKNNANIELINKEA